jgi:hypothetical protein
MIIIKVSFRVREIGIIKVTYKYKRLTTLSLVFLVHLSLNRDLLDR